MQQIYNCGDRARQATQLDAQEIIERHAIENERKVLKEANLKLRTIVTELKLLVKTMKEGSKSPPRE